MAVTDIPEIRYARTADGVHIAFQVWGEGPLDLLEISTTNISIDEVADEPHVLRYERRLASFSRLIRFDRHGVGFSDPVPSSGKLDMEREVDVALAVLDAAGSEEAVLLGSMSGAMVGLLCAAIHPGRVRSLVLANGFPRMSRAEDYPIGISTEYLAASADKVRDRPEDFDDLPLLAPSLASDPEFRHWWSRAARRGAGPVLAHVRQTMTHEADVRSVLPIISVPTLILTREVFAPFGRYMAERIPGAIFVELPGSDVMPYSGDADSLVDEIEEFVTGHRQRAHAERFLATVMFSDIVASTELAAQLGDRRWHELLQDHDDMSRRQVERFRGQFVKSTGDGILATFDGPARAVECASAIRARAQQLDLSVRLGLHTGEIERLPADVGGIAVHIAARVSAMAAPGQVLVSSTVKDLVVGSGIEFEDRGQHELKGVPGTWRLFAARS
jgi:class 3 adenylate cyclase